jgi:hypothetical protein
MRFTGCAVTDRSALPAAWKFDPQTIAIEIISVPAMDRILRIAVAERNGKVTGAGRQERQCTDRASSNSMNEKGGPRLFFRSMYVIFPNL